MYISTRERLGRPVGLHGLGQCDDRSADAMSFTEILDAIQCELQRKFTDPNDPRLLTRRRRLRELFNGVPPAKAKDLFDQLQLNTDPLAQLLRGRIAPATRKEMLSILFFAEYDLRFEPNSPTSGVQANPKMTAADKTKRIAQVEDAVGRSPTPPPDHLTARRDDRARLALGGLILAAAPASAALSPIAQDLSISQLDLFREFFPDGAGGIKFDDFRRAFEQFANGELRDPLFPGKREPNGGFFFLFAEFAFLCIDSKIDEAEWSRALRVFVQTQEIFMHIYRPPPHRAPPLVGARPPKCPELPLLGPIGRRGLDGPGGFDDSHFDALGQSTGARIIALRAKYAGMGPAALRKAAAENLQRAQCMP